MRVLETTTGDLSEPSAASRPIALPARELVMQFESLGGRGHGCEFGYSSENSVLSP